MWAFQFWPQFAVTAFSALTRRMTSARILEPDPSDSCLLTGLSSERASCRCNLLTSSQPQSHVLGATLGILNTSGPVCRIGFTAHTNYRTESRACQLGVLCCVLLCHVFPQTEIHPSVRVHFRLGASFAWATGKRSSTACFTAGRPTAMAVAPEVRYTLLCSVRRRNGSCTITSAI